MGWKKFAKTEMGTAGQVEHESHVDSFFTSRGAVHHEFLRQCQTVNRWYYVKVLKHLTENVMRKRHQLGETTPGSSIMTMSQLLHRN
jgi:hypothetical protein